VPGGYILDTFGALGASWAQVGAKGVLESALGCILAGFWLNLRLEGVNG